MKTGLFLGKFSPLHAGHELVIRFAMAMVDHLDIMVCKDPEDIIPLSVRWEWFRQFESDRVRIITNPNIVYTKKEEDLELFWHEWVENCSRLQYDYVFGGEEYCGELAHRLGAQFLPVWRNGLEDISATKIRENPRKYWYKIADVAKPYYIKRVSFIGVESAGKSSLVHRLKDYYLTSHVDEWARQYHHGTFTYEDMLLIGKGQVALENARAMSSPYPLMLCDTDPLMTYVASMQLFGKADPALKKLAQEHNPYVTTILMNGDVLYVPDEQREQDKLIGSPVHEDNRILRIEPYIEAVRGEFKRPHLLVTGDDYNDRMWAVINHLDPLIYY